MDHKAWRWRKRLSEKTITVNGDVSLSTKDAEEKNYMIKRIIELERSVEFLNEKLTSTIADSSAKDDLVAQHAKVAEEAIAGWEKVEAEALIFKKELEDVLRLRVAAEERVLHLDSSLKECILQLRHAREEQEEKIHEAIMKTSREFDKTRIDLENRLDEIRKRVCEMDFENNRLIKALQLKDKLIDDLNKHKCQIEEDFTGLLRKMDCTEHINSSLTYEVCMLQKELEIQNEEKKFSHKEADVSHKQHIDDMKKIAMLETECQRLRQLVRKRLPGPAALAKMKHEVETLERDTAIASRKKPHPVMVDPDIMYENKRIASLTEQLSAMEEENKILKESLNKRKNELQASRAMCARTASRLSQYGAQIGELGKRKNCLEHFRSTGPFSSDLALVSISENVEASCAESWASALISELENFKNERSKSPSCKSVGASDLSLMDDFIEMEKLALVSVDDSVGGSQISHNECNKALVPLETDLKDYFPVVTGKEIVPLEGFCNDRNEKSSSWLEDVLKLILQQMQVTQKGYDVILEEVRISLTKMDGICDYQVTNSSIAGKTSICGYIGPTTPCASTKDSFNTLDGTGVLLVETNSTKITSSIYRSIQKITELIEGIDIHEVPSEDSGTSSAYTVRVFQWKSSELGNILHNFVLKCNDLVRGKTDYEAFIKELSSTLEWILNHCFSLQDVSSMKDSIHNHYDWDDTHSENEFEECKDIFPQMEKISELKLIEENKRLKHEIMNMMSGKKLLEDRLQTTTKTTGPLGTHLQESGKSIASLHKELALVKQSKGMMENQDLLHEDLDTKLSIAKIQLNEAHQKFTSLDVEFEDKKKCCVEPEVLQIQLESAAKTESSNGDINQVEKHIRTEWDVSRASEKLAECQETILNLGKQLKALASPRDAALFDKTVTATSPAKSNRRSSLLDQMLAEEDVKVEELSSPKTKEIISTGDSMEYINPNRGLLYGRKLSKSDETKSSKHLPEKCEDLDANKYSSITGIAPLAVVPMSTKSRGGFLKKLLMRKKREGSKRKLPAMIAR